MHVPAWLLLSGLALFMWGIAGLLQKLSTNHISAESALIWTVAGFALLGPLVYPGKSVANYSMRSVTFGLLAGVINAVGSWAMFAALRKGGKAAIVVPMTSLYPVVVVLAAPVLLGEAVTLLQGVGIVCALGAVVLLAT